MYTSFCVPLITSWPKWVSWSACSLLVCAQVRYKLALSTFIRALTLTNAFPPLNRVLVCIVVLYITLYVHYANSFPDWLRTHDPPLLVLKCGGHWHVNGSTIMGTNIVRYWFAWSTCGFPDAKPRSNQHLVPGISTIAAPPPICVTRISKIKFFFFESFVWG